MAMSNHLDFKIHYRKNKKKLQFGQGKFRQNIMFTSQQKKNQIQKEKHGKC